MNLAELDPYALAELMEATAEELEKRGEKMLKLSRQLLSQAAHHSTLAALPAERSLARGGVTVTEKEAIAAARELGEHFSTAAYAERLGLSRSGAMRWLTKLLSRTPPVIERHEDATYAYLTPPKSRAPAKRAAVERSLIDVSVTPDRGLAVHVNNPKARKRSINVSGQGHFIKQRDARRQKTQAAQAAKRNGTGKH